MTIDFFVPSEDPRAEQQTYFDVLTKAADLAEALQARVKPVASEIFYRVSDPTIISRVVLPIELPQSELVSVRIEFSESSPEDMTYSDRRLVLEFSDKSECHIPVCDDRPDALKFQVAPSRQSTIWKVPIDPETDMPCIMEGTMPRQQVSDIIARVIAPHSDPAFCDFRFLNTQSIRAEICETLENTDYVSTSKVYTYLYDEHEIIVMTEGGRVLEVSIEQAGPLDDDFAITLRTTLDRHAHSQEIFVYEGGERSQRPPFPEDIAAFRDILDDLLTQLNPMCVSYDSYRNEVVAREFGDRKAPEERP